MTRRSCLRGLLGSAALASMLALGACSSTADKPKPGPLPALSGSLNVTRAWTLQLPETVPQMVAPLQAVVNGSRIVLALQQGLLAEIDADSGKEIWRLALTEPLSAGVGSDGRRHAVVTASNTLRVLQDGREIWRQQLNAQSYTPPLVAGERVFVQTAERTVLAFDGATGQRLWSLARTGEPLVLRQAGVLVAQGDTLLAGNGGRLSAIQPLTGQVRWDVVIGSSRGTNEVERLVDLVSGVSRQGQVVCVRAFQTAVGCVDAARGQLVWTRASQGHEGLDGDDTRVFGTESDGRLRAWSRRDGQPLWSEDQYRFRGLTAPRVWGSAVVYGDAQGQVHLLGREDGRSLQRLSTDDTAMVMTPVVVGRTLVTLNRSGRVTGWRTE